MADEEQGVILQYVLGQKIRNLPQNVEKIPIFILVQKNELKPSTPDTRAVPGSTCHLAIGCQKIAVYYPVVSTNQKIRVRWKKVKEAYEAARMERPHMIPRRTVNMLKCRWGRVAPACLKWFRSYDEALRRKKSGTRDEVVLKEAHLIHQRKHGNFNLIEQWIILGKKRTRTEEDSKTPTSEPQGGSSTRPEGVKKAKARMTGKMVADQSIQALSAFGEILRLNSEIMKEKTELQKQKEARKQKQIQMEEYQMNWNIDQTLSKKETLQPREADMMVQLGQYF
ncbi:uncharacterized protein LOC130810949 [Amaranthus tricolor]|uniref:uncharacterized protein LOC130810949 n=1 Tax=Amaranthus tricolor TaxID=29722 RepID=UPI00258EAFF7|nr:uncharacterized protein LOC130810949 [Amaranthus tricolor]